MPGDKYMHLFHILIASGLLVFSRFPAEQPPPAIPNDNLISIEAAQLSSYGSTSPGSYSGNPSYLLVTPYSTTPQTPTQTPSAPATKYDNWQTTYHQPSVLPITGLAMYYNPNVMQEVVRNREAMYWRCRVAARW
jgi:hypothetical protein